MSKKDTSNDNNSNLIVNMTNLKDDDDDVDIDDVLIDEPPVLSRCPSPYKNDEDNEDEYDDTKNKNTTDKNKNFKKRRNKKSDSNEKSSKSLKNRLMLKTKNFKKKDNEGNKSISTYFMDSERKDERSSCDDSPPTLFRSISANDDDVHGEKVAINGCNGESSIDPNEKEHEKSEKEPKNNFDVDVEAVVQKNKSEESYNDLSSSEELKKCSSMPNLIKSITNTQMHQENNIDEDVKNEDDVYDGLRESFSSSDMPQLFEIKDDFKNNTSDAIEINGDEVDNDNIKSNRGDNLKTKVVPKKHNGEHNDSASDNEKNDGNYDDDDVNAAKVSKLQSKNKRKYESGCGGEINVEMMHKKSKTDQKLNLKNDKIAVENELNDVDLNISLVKSDCATLDTSSLGTSSNAASSTPSLHNHCCSTSSKVSSNKDTDLLPTSDISSNATNKDISGVNVTKTHDASNTNGPVNKSVSNSLSSSNLNGDERCDRGFVKQDGEDNREINDKINLKKKDCVLSLITNSENDKEL